MTLTHKIRRLPEPLRDAVSLLVALAHFVALLIVYITHCPELLVSAQARHGVLALAVVMIVSACTMIVGLKTSPSID